MQFANVIRTTTIDYPGKLSYIVYTIGCNLDCVFCHNRGLAQADDGIDTIGSSEILKQLEERRKFVDRIVITGGEPTIYSILPDFCRTLKNMGYSIKLDTNGLRSKLLEDTLPYLDHVAMDLKSSLSRYDQFLSESVRNMKQFQSCAETLFFEQLTKSMSALSRSGISHEYRTTPTPQTCTRADFRDIATTLGRVYRNIEQSYKPTWFIQTTRKNEDDTRFDLYSTEELQAIIKEHVNCGLNIEYR